MALLVTGVCELADTVFEQMLDTDISVGHGIVLYSVSESGRLLHIIFEDVESASEMAVAVEASDDSESLR